jgi:hypothetical protein
VSNLSRLSELFDTRRVKISQIAELAGMPSSVGFFEEEELFRLSVGTIIASCFGHPPTCARTNLRSFQHISPGYGRSVTMAVEQFLFNEPEPQDSSIS